jgi:hypothetical protein
MFTTKFTKGSKDAVKPFVKKFAEGGTVEDDDDKRTRAQRALANAGETFFGLARSKRALEQDRASDVAAAKYISRKVRPDLKEED